MMQNLTLPIQASGAAPQRTSANATPGSDAAAFSAALSREVEQRQQAANDARQATASRAPAPQRPPVPVSPAADASEAQPSTADLSTNTAPAVDTTNTTDATAEDQDDDTVQSAAAQVTDMLALVASLNLPASPAAAASPAQSAAAAAGQAATGLGRGKGGNDAAQLAALQQAIAAPGKDDATPAAGKFFDRLHGLATGAPGMPAAPATLSGQPGALAQSKQPGARGAATNETDLSQPGDVAAAKPPAQPAAGNVAAAPGQPASHEAAAKVADAGALKETLAQHVASAQDVAATALLSPAMSAPLQVAQAAGVVPDHIAARVGTPAWDQQVGQKIVWMVAGEEQSASLTLNPPDLGPMQVVLSVTNDQASVAFSSHEPEVRQALQDALPRLREMMSDSGIALGNATVDAGMPDGRQAQGGEQPRSGAGPARVGGGTTRPDADPLPKTRVTTLGGRGAVDTFA
jgi:flagellar hook-length control protein FliK